MHGPGLLEKVLVVCLLTQWPVPWPFASSMYLRFLHHPSRQTGQKATIQRNFFFFFATSAADWPMSTRPSFKQTITGPLPAGKVGMFLEPQMPKRPGRTWGLSFLCLYIYQAPGRLASLPACCFPLHVDFVLKGKVPSCLQGGLV